MTFRSVGLSLVSRNGLRCSTARKLLASTRPKAFESTTWTRSIKTSAVGPGTPSPSPPSSWAGLLAAAVGTGLVGYAYGSRKSSSPTSTTSASHRTARSDDQPAAIATKPEADVAPCHPDTPVYGTPEDFDRAIEELKSEFKDAEQGVSTDPDNLLACGFSPYDYHPGAPHSVVVYPQTTEDVVKIVKIANKYRMPIIPLSGHTSLEGATSGTVHGGICVDLSGMDRILKIHAADADIVCQPGALWMDINSKLEDMGIPLFFPLDPAPTATVGGMLSTGCSGTNAVRYGTAKGEWFLNATVVLPSGEVIKTRQRSRKSSAGFDLTKLFIGAEGTLGIVTEVTIRLTPVLPTTVAVVHFPNVQKATEASIDAINVGAGIQCIELVDDVFMRGTNKVAGTEARRFPEKDSLFIKFQGPSSASLQETAALVESIAAKHGGTGFTLAKDEKEAKELWQYRKNALFSGLALVEGSRGWSTDVCVPVSNLPQLVQETKEDLATIGLTSTIVGHVGDGNFHALLLFCNDEELEIARQAVHRMNERAIRLEGTCTGEHGVGIGKKKYLYQELGAGTIELMKTIKRSIDPHGLFNPGKLYPDPPAQVQQGH